MTYRLWVSEDRKTLVRLWSDGAMEVARREDLSDAWGPPTRLVEEPGA